MELPKTAKPDLDLSWMKANGGALDNRAVVPFNTPTTAHV